MVRTHVLKLAERGTFTIIGKVTNTVGGGQHIQLLQKSVLSSALSLLNSLVALQGETDSLTRYMGSMALARSYVTRLGLLEVPGPAVRVAAMSVCI